MNINNELRLAIKELKIYKGISYKELAEEYLEIKPSSLYAQLYNSYDFSSATQNRLKDIIDILKD